MIQESRLPATSGVRRLREYRRIRQWFQPMVAMTAAIATASSCGALATDIGGLRLHWIILKTRIANVTRATRESPTTTCQSIVISLVWCGRIALRSNESCSFGNRRCWPGISHEKRDIPEALFRTCPTWKSLALQQRLQSEVQQTCGGRGQGDCTMTVALSLPLSWCSTSERDGYERFLRVRSAPDACTRTGSNHNPMCYASGEQRVLGNRKISMLTKRPASTPIRTPSQCRAVRPQVE